MPGCIDCKLYESHLNGFDNYGKAIIKRTCLANHNKEMHQWWKENGQKLRRESDHMECHVQDQGLELLNDLCSTLGSIINTLNDD